MKLENDNQPSKNEQRMFTYNKFNLLCSIKFNYKGITLAIFFLLSIF